MVFRTLSRSSLGTFPASNGYKVDLSSSGLIDHLKYIPLIHCNMLIQPSSLFFWMYSSPKPLPTTRMFGVREPWNVACVPEALWSPQCLSLSSLSLQILLFFYPFSVWVFSVLFPVPMVFSSGFTFPLISAFCPPICPSALFLHLLLPPD